MTMHLLPMLVVLFLILNYEASNRDCVDDTTSPLATPFSHDEVLAKVKSLKTGKASGPDGLTNEHIKNADRTHCIFIQCHCQI